MAFSEFKITEAISKYDKYITYVKHIQRCLCNVLKIHLFGVPIELIGLDL